MARSASPLSASLGGVVRLAAELGFKPTTVLDVGVDDGTPELYAVYPKARYVLVEPLVERRQRLRQLAEQLGGAVIVEAAAGATAGEATFWVHDDLAGSSLFREMDGPVADGEKRTVPVVTLDEVCHRNQTRGPYLLKVDTQGSELEVIAGAKDVLAETELVLLEASLFGFYHGGPQFSDVVTTMQARGFVVWDIFGGHRRPLDLALAQVDLAFVREDGRFRQSHRFATDEQRRGHLEHRRRTLWQRLTRRVRRLLVPASSPTDHDPRPR